MDIASFCFGGQSRKFGSDTSGTRETCMHKNAQEGNRVDENREEKAGQAVGKVAESSLGYGVMTFPLSVSI